MNRLIKRYILKTQRDKDNDEVNEGEFDHLKKKKKFKNNDATTLFVLLIKHR